MRRLLLVTMAFGCVLAFASIDRVTPVAAQSPIEIGSEVEVTGTGSCLNVREEYYETAPILECLPDGTRARVTSATADEWYFLLQHGWVSGKWLRMVAPPAPNLQQSADVQPSIPGLIAYIEDRNARITDSTGTTPLYLTTDGHTSSIPQWSPDGRFLAFTHGAESNIVNMQQIGLYDAATGAFQFIGPAPGRNFGSIYWFDAAHLWFTDTRADFYGCDKRTYSDQSIQSLNVLTGEKQLVVASTSDEEFIGSMGTASPDGRFVAYGEGWYCEGPGFTCAFDVEASTSHCLLEGTWSRTGWVNDHELLLEDTPPEEFTRPPGGPKEPIVFDVAAGNTRPASPQDRAEAFRVIGPLGGNMREDASRGADSPTLDTFYRDTRVLAVPIQQRASITVQALAPDESAFVFQLTSSPSGQDQGIWIGLTDGSSRAWRLTTGGSQPIWQPHLLPPVLFIHGCGGGLGTWADPGWITNATEIGDFTFGDASGKLLRAVIPQTPAVPAYVLDYSGSAGSVFDLAALIPQAIDKIKEETGAEKVMLVTHSMGGVLAQAYEAGLASGQGYDNDVEADFMVAPPSRGSFLVNWLTGGAGNALACPQASELGPNSKSIVRLETAVLPDLSYSVVSGTRLWLPFVGLNDGVVADGDVGLNDVSYDKRQVSGIHTDVTLLPNTVAALCTTVLGQACTPELRMDDVKEAFRQRYAEDMLK